MGNEFVVGVARLHFKRERHAMIERQVVVCAAVDAAVAVAEIDAVTLLESDYESRLLRRRTVALIVSSADASSAA